MNIKSISSRDNPLYRQVRQLATSSQARRKQGKTILDGVHLCQAWLQHRGMPALCVVSESGRSHAEAGGVLHACASGDASCILLSDALFAPLSQVDHGVDLLFVIDTPRQPLLKPISAISGSTVILDGLQDPGNLGSILRTAAAAGIASVYCGSGTVFAWSPKVLRAAMGAHFVLDIFEDIDLRSLMTGSGIPVLATSSHAQSSVFDIDLSGPCAWLFGHEGQGVSDSLLGLATQKITIPQQPGIESMNVAASAAVCLFEQVRQQRLGR